jgi:Ser/Thr protein kinase RdoA (MazF antagonist)
LIDSNDKIDFITAAVELWCGEANSLRHISNSANCVFSFVESGKKRFIRLTSIYQRTKNQIEAELDFVAFLHRGGIGATLPLVSANARLIEEINFGEKTLFACVFAEAEGERFNYDSAKSIKEHFRLRGRTLGQIHALSKNYIPAGEFRRFAWDEDKLLIEADKFLPQSEKIVWREYDKLKEQLQNYPKSNEIFGLIHGDFGETNYRYRDNQLNIFDFDDCCYHWFIYDIAVTIYPHGWRKEGLQLLDWLLEGYSENMRFNKSLADIVVFCQWRLLYMFLVYAKKWGFEHLSEQQAMWFAQKRENITRGYMFQT